MQRDVCFFLGLCYIQTSSMVNLNTGFVWVLILCFKMIRKTMSCCSPADRCTWPHLPDYFFHLISRFQQIPTGRAALTCPSRFTSHSPLCNDTDCDFKHFITFLFIYLFFFTATNKVLLSQQMNNGHMQIARQFLTAQNKHFLVCNNYCKTLENPWGTALCQWLKRLMTVLKAAHRDKSKI